LNLPQLVEKLRINGILLLSDPYLPSVVNLVAGGRVKGSWWGHKKGHEIFRDLGMLESHPDVLVTRLVSGKVTYLHRSLWPDFLSVATAREEWQTKGLPVDAKRLLELVDADGEVGSEKGGAGKAARELERRLLVCSEEIHTEKGFHAKILMTWSRCPNLRDLKVRLREPKTAKNSLERLVDDLNKIWSGKGKLPWRQKYTEPRRSE
jgi:hypothetical protein